MADWETIGEGALDVGLGIASFMVPGLGAVFSIIKDAVPAIIAARPYIIKAVQDGESAFHAAEAASPGLGAKLRTIAEHIAPKLTGDFEQHLEAVTRSTLTLYQQNLHDSGYDPKNDRDEHGNMKVSG